MLQLETFTFGYKPARTDDALDLDCFTFRWPCGCELEQYRSGAVVRRQPCPAHIALVRQFAGD